MGEKKTTTKTVFLSDAHIPFEDEAALNAAYDFIEDVKPDEIVIIGDWVDFYDVSRFSKDPHREGDIQTEIDEAKEWLRKLRTKAPESKIYYIEGNHERRLEKYLMANPELAALEALEVPKLLSLEDLDIEYCQLDKDLKLGDYWVIHGDEDSGARLSQHSGGSAKATIERFGTSVIMGHSHRLGAFYKTLYDGEVLEGFEIGCLCENLDYVHNPNWQSAIALLERNGKADNVTLIRIDDGYFVYGGKVYGGKKE